VYVIHLSGINLKFVLLFQASVVLDSIAWQKDYPMDFYSNLSLGAWTVNHESHRKPRPARNKINPNLDSESPGSAMNSDAKEDSSVNENVKDSNLGADSSPNQNESCGTCDDCSCDFPKY
jgi:2-(3-amino-3-carboxypropyl)histidine synthase